MPPFKGSVVSAAERRAQGCPQRIVVDLGQHILSELEGVPCIETLAKVVLVGLQVSRGQAFERTDALLVEARRLS